MNKDEKKIDFKDFISEKEKDNSPSTTKDISQRMNDAKQGMFLPRHNR